EGRLGAIVLERGWLTPRELANAIARQHALPLADLDRVDPQVAAPVPRDSAQRHRVLPLERTPDGGTVVAVADPGDVEAIDTLRLLLGDVRLRVAPEDALALAIKRAY